MMVCSLYKSVQYITEPFMPWGVSVKLKSNSNFALLFSNDSSDNTTSPN